MIFLKPNESSRTKLPPLITESGDQANQEANSTLGGNQSTSKWTSRKSNWTGSLLESSKGRRQEASESARLLVNTNFAHVDTVRLEKKPTQNDPRFFSNDTNAVKRTQQPMVQFLQPLEPKANLNVTFSDQFAFSRKDNPFGKSNLFFE